MTVRARDARPGDYPIFARLFPELRVPDPVPDVAQFAERIAPHAVIVEDGEGPVGYGLVHVYSQTAHVAHVISAPEARGRGVGAAVLAALAERARTAGCVTVYLNVKPDNAPAIRLYERAGFRPVGGSKRMEIAWRDVDRLPASAALAFVPGPDEDRQLERAFGLAEGCLAPRRAQTDVFLFAVADPDPVGIAAFDVRFPGASPFRARRPDLARALLEAMRPRARPADDAVGLVVDAADEIDAALLSAGATISFEIVRMEALLGG